MKYLAKGLLVAAALATLMLTGCSAVGGDGPGLNCSQPVYHGKETMPANPDDHF